MDECWAGLGRVLVSRTSNEMASMSTDDGGQQEDAGFVGRRSGRVIRPLSSGES